MAIGIEAWTSRTQNARCKTEDLEQHAGARYTVLTLLYKCCWDGAVPRAPYFYVGFVILLELVRKSVFSKVVLLVVLLQ